MKRVSSAAILLALALAACGSPESRCEGAGGRCVLGGATCFGTVDNGVDCNPDRNPGGAFCCVGVVCPGNDTPLSDGGCR